MKFNLKKALKEVYCAEKPDNAKSFAKELAKNLIFRKLHPVSSVLNAYPIVKPAAAAIAALMAVGGGFLAMNLASDKNDGKEENISSYASEQIEVTYTTASNEIIYTTEAHSSITSLTETTAAVSTTETSSTTVLSSSSTTASATRKASVITTARANAVSAGNSYIPTAAVTTAAPPEHSPSLATTTTKVTEIYNTHIWKHDYRFDRKTIAGYSREEISEAAKSLYGYPRNDMEVSLGGLCFISQNIVYGTVQDLNYTVIDGKPWTAVDMKIERSYHFERGDELFAGDVITIYEPGGYMPLADYIAYNPSDKSFSSWSSERIANTVIYEDGSNQVKPEIGDSYLYFTNKITENNKGSGIPDDFPTDVYIRPGLNDVSQFSFDGERFVCSNSAQNISFTEEELIEYSPSQWNYYTAPDGKRTLSVRQYSSLFYGDAAFYIPTENGRMKCLGYDFTYDGFPPFDDEYTISEDENGNCIMEGEYFTITWTDSKVIVSFNNGFPLDERTVLEFDYSA